jgi:sialate O-acetylesterase
MIGLEYPMLKHATPTLAMIVIGLAMIGGFPTRVLAADAPRLRTHNVFQSNMVLQRDKPVTIWGWAAPGRTVTVEFAGSTVKSTAKTDGTWQLTLSAMPASSTARTMTITSGDAKLTYENILVGDIWVLGGQSNMEQPISRVENGGLEIVSANFPSIRIASVPQRAGPEHARDWPTTEHSDVKRHNDRRAVWHECSPKTVGELSAIGYVFARRIHMATQVPIGVIDASRWGTTVEAWTPRPVLRKIDSPPVRAKLTEWDARVESYEPAKALEARIKAYNDRTERMRAEGRDVSGRTPPTTPPANPNTNFNYPGNCYAGMIAPLEGLAIKGAIFHQGFNNCGGGTPGGDHVPGHFSGDDHRLASGVRRSQDAVRHPLAVHRRRAADP